MPVCMWWETWIIQSVYTKYILLNKMLCRVPSYFVNETSWCFCLRDVCVLNILIHFCLSHDAEHVLHPYTWGVGSPTCQVRLVRVQAGWEDCRSLLEKSAWKEARISQTCWGEDWGCCQLSRRNLEGSNHGGVGEAADHAWERAIRLG